MSYIQAIIASISASAGGPPPPPPPPNPYKSWTIEWWEKKLSPQSVGSPRVFAVGVDTGASIGYSNESGGDYVWTGGVGTGPLTVGSIANAWHHFAVVSNSVNLTVFKDGVALTSVARAGNAITDASTNFLLGGDTNFHWKGRLADFHIIKGVAKYNANFTPPTRLQGPETGTVLIAASPAQYGPGAVVFAGNSVADDPWADAGSSWEFLGNTGSYAQFAGNSIFALDSQ